MDWHEIKEIIVCIMFYGFLCLIVAGIGFGITWWGAGQEADAYFRATGKRIPQWDALFLELRIENK